VPNTNNGKGVNYSKLLKNSLDEAGIAAFEINTDELDSKKNLEQFKRFQAADCPTKILICKGMAKIGFSDPEVDAVICLRNDSEDEIAQSAGRAMRLSSRRKGAYVIGFHDVKAELVFQANPLCADEKALVSCTPAYLEQRQRNQGVIECRENTPPAVERGAQAWGGEDSVLMPMDEADTQADETIPAQVRERYGLFAQGFSKRNCRNIDYDDEIRQLEAELTCAQLSYGRPSFPYGGLRRLKDELSQLVDIDLKTRLLQQLLTKIAYPLAQLSPKSYDIASAIEEELPVAQATRPDFQAELLTGR